MGHLTLHHLDSLVKMLQLLHQVLLAGRRRGLYHLHFLNMFTLKPLYDLVVLLVPLLPQLIIQLLERCQGQSLLLGNRDTGCLLNLRSPCSDQLQLLALFDQSILVLIPSKDALSQPSTAPSMARAASVRWSLPMLVSRVSILTTAPSMPRITSEVSSSSHSFRLTPACLPTDEVTEEASPCKDCKIRNAAAQKRFKM